ncbi:MAG: hypothetical protein WD830_07255 [Chloroflexota bacterium]
MIPRYFDLPASFPALAAATPGSVLLESSRPDVSEHTSLLFRDPAALLQLKRLEDAPQFFR